jgi:hypothetical protein
MRLRNIVKLTHRFEQTLGRKFIGTAQGFKPADNLIKRPKSVIARNLVNYIFQTAGCRQRMPLILLTKNSAKIPYFVEHSAPAP